MVDFGRACATICATKIRCVLIRRPGRLHRLRFWSGDGRERFQRGGHVEQPNVRVPIHRQRDGRMPCELLGELRMNATGNEVADEGVTQRMEVGNAVIGDVGNPGRF